MKEIDNLPAMYVAHTQFGPTLTLAPSILRHEAHFSPKNTSAPIMIRADAYFGQEIRTSARNNFDPIHFDPQFSSDFALTHSY